LLPRWLVHLRRRQHEGGRPSVVTLRAANSAAVLEAVDQGAADVGFVACSEPRG